MVLDKMDALTINLLDLACSFLSRDAQLLAHCHNTISRSWRRATASGFHPACAPEGGAVTRQSGRHIRRLKSARNLGLGHTAWRPLQKEDAPIGDLNDSQREVKEKLALSPKDSINVAPPALHTLGPRPVGKHHHL
jgi:hypothetical protein